MAMMYDSYGGISASTQDQAPGKARGPGKEQSLRAVTIRQLVLAEADAMGDADLVVDGAELSNVTLVGRVLTVEEAGAHVELTISDGTGAVGVRVFADAGDPASLAQKAAEWRGGPYVRVYGHVRPYQGGRHVQAFSARTVHDPNEVTFHLVQAIFQHMHFAKAHGAGGAAAPTPAVKQEASPFGGGAAPSWQPSAAAGAVAGGAAAAAGSGSACGDEVLAVLADAGTGDSGMHIDEIVSRLAPRGFGRAQVSAALDQLQNDARVFTTCDDSHWKPV